MKSDYDCNTTRKIICPYCYNECEDDRYEVVRNGADNYISFTCENCDKEFKVMANIDISYTSARLDENNNIVEEWTDLEEGDCKYGCIGCIFEDTDVCDKCIDLDMYDDEDK